MPSRPGATSGHGPAGCRSPTGSAGIGKASHVTNSSALTCSPVRPVTAQGGDRHATGHTEDLIRITRRASVRFVSRMHIQPYARGDLPVRRSRRAISCGSRPRLPDRAERRFCASTVMSFVQRASAQNIDSVPVRLVDRKARGAGSSMRDLTCSSASAPPRIIRLGQPYLTCIGPGSPEAAWTRSVSSPRNARPALRVPRGLRAVPAHRHRLGRAGIDRLAGYQIDLGTASVGMEPAGKWLSFDTKPVPARAAATSSRASYRHILGQIRYVASMPCVPAIMGT